MFDFSLTGVYLGPPKTVASLFRWPTCYRVLMFSIQLGYCLHTFYFFLRYGAAMLYYRVGSDSSETKMDIDSLLPISGLTFTSLRLVHFVCQLANLLLLAFRGWSLVRILQTYQRFDVVRWRALAFAIGLVVICLIQAYGVTNSYHHPIVRLLGYIFIFLHQSNLYLWAALILHFLVMNLQCLQQYRASLATDSIVEVFKHVHQIEQHSRRVKQFFEWISTNTFLAFVQFQMLLTFYLLFTTLQHREAPVFTNPVLTTTSNTSIFLVGCCLADYVVYKFDQFYHRLNRKMLAYFSTTRSFDHQRAQHWRVEAFLLVQCRDQFRARIFHLFTIDFANLVQVCIFSFNTAILLFQLEFM